MTNKSVVVWQHGAQRIVALDVEGADAGPCLVMEERLRDAMGADMWLTVCFHDDCAASAALLMAQVVSRVDVVPPWVKKFVRDDLEMFADEGDDEAGGAA